MISSRNFSRCHGCFSRIFLLAVSLYCPGFVGLGCQRQEAPQDGAVQNTGPDSSPANTTNTGSSVPEFAARADSEPIDVELAFFRVRKLHQTFFSDGDALHELGRNLAGRVRDPAQLRIAYESETSHGRIVLVIPPGNLLIPVGIHGSALEMQSLTPLTWALARYRDAISASYDVRISNFDIALYFLRGATSCTFQATGGHPPDGKVISTCPEIDGELRCGEHSQSGVVFSAEDMATIKTCLDL